MVKVCYNAITLNKKTKNMPAFKPEISITETAPINTAALRTHDVFKLADPEGEVPDVVLAPAMPDPLDKPSSRAQRTGINVNSEQVGTFNLIQAGDRSWLRRAEIAGEHQGKRYAVAAYLGVITALHESGRQLESDPQGISSEANRVWASLTRRGVVQPLEGVQDVHGNPRYVSIAG